MSTSHAEIDRGSQHVPTPLEHHPWTSVWQPGNPRRARDLQPFREGCLAADRPLITTLRLRLHRGRGPCCWYHQGDWARAVAIAQTELETAAARTVDGMDRDLPSRLAVHAIDQRDDAHSWEADAATSLLLDPIDFNNGGDVVNGQHRLRAMRDQGARRVLLLKSVHDDDLQRALTQPGSVLFDPSTGPDPLKPVAP